jgi:tRNA threonylcarbamoyladenosine biosynthesis protein TsaB
MNVLGIDTATGCLGVMARKGDEEAVFSANSGLRHGENLLTSINQLLSTLALEPKGLDLIVCALGPGSFTGLRIGLATAKGMALAAGCPLAGAGSLDVFGARFAFFRGAVLPVIDARKGRFYTAVFEGGRRTDEYLDLLPGEMVELASGLKSVLLTGPDADKIFLPAAAIKKPENVSILVSKQELPTLIELGIESFKQKGGLPDGAGPIYVRPSEAELVSRNKNRSSTG